MHAILLYILLMFSTVAAAQENASSYVFSLFPTNDHCSLNKMGSGFAFKKGNNYFLVTALHVLTKTPRAFKKFWPQNVLDSSHRYLYFSYNCSSTASPYFINLYDTCAGYPLYRTFSVADKLLDLAIIKLNENDPSLQFIFKNAFELSEMDTTSSLTNQSLVHAVGLPLKSKTVYDIFGTHLKNDPQNEAIFWFEFERAQYHLGGISGGVIFRIDQLNVDQPPVGMLVAATDDGRSGLGIYLHYAYNMINNWE